MRIYINTTEIEALKSWVDCPASLIEKLGLEECYLLEITNTSTGVTHYEIYDHPLITNMSGEIKISGWLGTTNNISTTALGKFPSIPAALKSLTLDLEPDEVDELDRETVGLLWSGKVIPSK